MSKRIRSNLRDWIRRGRATKRGARAVRSRRPEYETLVMRLRI
jgi:hypothetical protein